MSDATFSPRTTSATLVVVSSDLEGLPGRRIELAGAALRIGRSEECDLVLAVQTVSRRHAELTPTASGWLLRDLGSANGVWLGQQRIHEHPLRDGDEFRLGGTVLRFEAQQVSQRLAVGPRVA
ncbi:MAG: FHA domain-containing protein, partial [Acidobacteriota bacterium]